MYQYFNCCTNWDLNDVNSKGGLSDMVDAEVAITRRTFLKHVRRDQLRRIEKQLGYDSHPKQGLTMAGDWHVSYHRSMLHGKRVYYFSWSRIEYVFVGNEKESC